MLKAIETSYRGYRFRSRLEARYGIFFDALGIKWEYEKEGYDLDSAGWYLPDFWLPHQGYWIEIKGQPPTHEELTKVSELNKRDDKTAILLSGNPYPGEYQVFLPHFTESTKYGEKASNYVWIECFVCHEISISSANHIYSNYGEHWYYCENCDVGSGRNLSPESADCMFHKGDMCSFEKDAAATPKLMTAYSAARSARFEHGETPHI